MTLLIYILLIVFVLVLYNLFNLWKNKEKSIEKNVIEKFRKEYERAQQEIYDLKLSKWETDNEFEIRHNAIYQNRGAIAEKITKELDIINNNFAFNPKDIKFVGRFIDLVIFDGVAEELEEINIYFIDILNKSHLDKSNYKAQLEKAIQNKRYNFEEINL